MILEIHTHSSEHSSCSSVSAADIVARCAARELQGVVLTDHHYLWSPAQLDDLRAACAVPDHFVILSGQEVTTSDFGDVLVYGADRSLPPGTSLLQIRQWFPRAGLVLAHPYRNGNSPSDAALRHVAVDAVEIFNANQRASENVRALQDWHRLKFTAVAGTDLHAAGYCGTYPTDFDHFVEHIADLAAEIRAGRCRPLLREFFRSGTSNLQVTELNLGGQGRRSPADRIIVKKHANVQALREGSRSHRIMAALADHGFGTGRFRVPEPLGQAEDHLLLIEQGVDGQSLFDELLRAEAPLARHYLECCAGWLARLHASRLAITPAGEFLENEPDRLRRYQSILDRVGHPHAGRIEEIQGAVIDAERRWYGDRVDLLVQSHGDFHPKNVFISRENADAPYHCTVTPIDFDSSYRLPPAFDVGTFLIQYENQFSPHPSVLRSAPPELFLEAYQKETGQHGRDFATQVELFKARTALSIIYYLVKVGLGDSEDLWRVMVSAERSLTRVASRR